MSSEPRPTQRPQGFETSRQPEHDLPTGGPRPDWLVGAEDFDGGQDQDRSHVEPSPPPERPKPGRPLDPASGSGGRGTPDPQVAWTAAASSIPKLTAAPRSEPPARPEADQEEDPPAPGDVAEGSFGHLAPPVGSGVAEPALQPPHEPFWLVWGEALMTNWRLQVLSAVLLALVAIAMFWPRHGTPGVSLAGIKGHPERWEGRSVTVSGKVGEVFEIGQGIVFNLHQGRDTVVVFTPWRRPARHDRVTVVGTVSTGYLDGVPRVALFESPGPGR